jgi:hypothetical protein
MTLIQVLLQWAPMQDLIFLLLIVLFFVAMSMGVIK